MDDRKMKLLHFVITTALSLVIALTVLNIFDLNLSIPLAFEKDALVHYNFAKNIQDTGWWLANPKLGLPDKQSFYDFPLTDTISLLVIKLLIVVGLSWYQSVNVFFLLTFPFTSVVALYVLNRLGVKSATALPLSIIYAFIPYHLYRGINHLFLSTYFTVPLGVLAAYLIATNRPPKKLETVILAAVIASSGPYYTFFSVFFILVGLLIAQAKQFDKKLLLKTGMLLAAIMIFFFLNLLPSILYSQKYGQNFNATIRSPSETELYGLKLTQLLLPIEDHNLNFLNKIYKRYSAYGAAINENQYSSLGFVSSVGFLLLIFMTVFRPKFTKFKSDVTAKINITGVFNLSAILLATVGGFSVIVSTYLNPTFRSVNRISIFIAFFALALLGYLLQNTKNKRSHLILVWALLPIALFDQVSQGPMRNFPKNQDAFYQWANYAKEVEAAAGENAKIYTLPFGLYPEGKDKPFMKIALLTDTVSWSAGAGTWRASSYWQYQNSRLPINEFLTTVINEGFTGLLVDASRYDPQKLLEIERLLKTVPVSYQDGEYKFYDLQGYISTNKIIPKPSGVFYYISGNCRNDYNEDANVLSAYWCVDNAYIVLENKTDKDLDKKLAVSIEYPETGRSELTFQITVPKEGTQIKIGKEVANNAVFPIPYDKTVWPINLGYPNLIIHDIRLLDVKSQ